MSEKLIVHKALDMQNVNKYVRKIRLVKHISENNNRENSKVREFFKNSGFEVIDNRDNGGRLWIIGEKTDIRDTVNSAITQFGISGKYASSKETNFKNGWYTKTNK